MTDPIAAVLSLIQSHGIYLIDLLLAFLGYILAKYSRFPPPIRQRLSQALINVIYPCLIFSSLTSYFRLELLLASWDLPLFLTLLMATGFLLGLLLMTFCPMKLWPKDIQKSFIFMAAMPNYVFIPLIITQGFWGDKATAYLILASFGGDLFLWLIAIPALGAKSKLLRTFLRPPVFTMLLALSLIIWDQDWVFSALTKINPALAKVGRFTVPVSMLIVGAYLGSQAFQRRGLGSQLFLSTLRLIATPLICGLVLYLAHFDAEKARVLFLIATMPTAIASAIMASLYGGNARYCAQQILISHVLALITVPLWLYGASYFF